MDKQKFIKAAAEIFGVDEGIMAAFEDSEFLTGDEFIEEYGEDMYNAVEELAKRIPLDWRQQAKARIMDKSLNENAFANPMDKIRANFYIQGKKKGLTGDALKAYADEKMNDWNAKQAAISDFSKDRAKEFHEKETNPDNAEFYSSFRGKEDYLNSYGIGELDPYVDDNEYLNESRPMKITENTLRKLIFESVRRTLNEMGDDRFNKYIQEDVAALHNIYDKWIHAPYKPEGMDEVLDKVMEAKDAMESLLYQEDFGPYEDEPMGI